MRRVLLLLPPVLSLLDGGLDVPQAQQQARADNDDDEDSALTALTPGATTTAVMITPTKKEGGNGALQGMHASGEYSRITGKHCFPTSITTKLRNYNAFRYVVT